ncbi:lipoprotein chaperone [bacterium BMS3Abin05]|nr:lipoprotein chaperone [bacterium BMS3Abin05]
MKKTGLLFLGVIFIMAGINTNPVFAKKKISAEKILKKVRERVQSINTLQASFKETFHWTMIDEVQKFSGELYIGEGDKFRLQTAGQIIVSDGKTLWTYDAGKNQVLIDNVSPSGDELLPRRLLLKFEKDYHPTLIGKKVIGTTMCYVLDLTSKTEDAFIPKMTVWIDSKNWLTKKLSYEDINQNKTTYELGSIKINKKLPEEIFRFKIKPGVQVIDMRN